MWGYGDIWKTSPLWNSFQVLNAFNHVWLVCLFVSGVKEGLTER